jgi:hypothetical protein
MGRLVKSVVIYFGGTRMAFSGGNTNALITHPLSIKARKALKTSVFKAFLAFILRGPFFLSQHLRNRPTDFG